MKIRIKYCIILLLILYLSSSKVYGELVDTVSGHITYPDGVGIPQVETLLRLLDYGITDTDTTDADGFFKVKADTNTVGVPHEVENKAPLKTEIYTNHPSPFGSSTRINFAANQAGTLDFVVYSITGEEVYKTELDISQPGWYGVTWDGKDLASGVYLARIGDQTTKLMMVKGKGMSSYDGQTGNLEKIANPKAYVNTDQQRFGKVDDINARLIMKSLGNTVYDDSTEFQIPSGGIDDFMYTLREQLSVGNLSFSIDEGDTVVIPKSTWQYATGNVAGFENLSPDWQLWEDQNNLYLKTNDPNANGFLEALIETTAPHATKDTSTVGVNIADLVRLSGKIVDNDFYRKLEDGSTGPPIAGYVKVDGQTIYTNDGLFSVLLPPTPNVTLKAQHIIGTDTLSFESSHDYAALVDNDSLILHPVTSYGMEPGQMPLFKLFYYLVNDRAFTFPYTWKKYIDKNQSTHRVVLPLINDIGDTMTVADQDSVENYLLSTYFNEMQNPPPILKLGLNDPTPIGEGGGQIIIFMRNSGNYSGVAVDFNNDGIIDEAYIKIAKNGGLFYYPSAAQEILTGEVGVNNLNDPRFTDISVLEGNSSSRDLLVFDNKLRHLGENYPPLEEIQRILGNVVMIDP